MSAIEATILLPGDVTTPAAGRRFVRAALESVETDPVLIETAELLRGVQRTTKGGKTVWFELSPLSHHGLD